MVGAPCNRLDEAIFSVCPWSVFWATILNKNTDFFFLLERSVYIACAGFRNVEKFSNCFSNVLFMCFSKLFLPNQNQAFVTLLLIFYYFISSLFICDS